MVEYHRSINPIDWFALAYLGLVSNCAYLLFSQFSQGILSGRSGESVTYQLISAGLYLILAAKLFLSGPEAWRILIRRPLFLLLVTSAVLSYFSAGVLAISAMRFTMYLLTVMFGLYIYLKLSADQFCEAIFFISIPILILHFISFPILAGQIIYDVNENRTNLLGLTAYAGYFGHKNIAGSFFSFSMIILLCRILNQKRTRNYLINVLLFIINTIALLMTGAVSPVLSLGFSFVCVLTLRSLYRGQYLNVFFTFVALCVAIVALINGVGAFFEWIGRNENLTGRDFLFAVFPRFFTERPVFGYGFNGFFTGEPGAPAEQLWEIAPWHDKFPTFESSYLEILIQFGIVGGLCFAAIILCALRNSWRFAHTSNSAYRYAPFGIMTFMLCSSLSDTYLTLQNYIYVVLLFWIYFGIELRPSKISKGNPSPPNFAREPIGAGPWIRRRDSRLRSGGVVRPRVAE